MLRRVRDYLVEPFLIDGKTNRILLTLFILINWWVLSNNIAHNPYIGYDAGHHLHYIGALSEGRLPTADDTGGFYYPPVPMAIPAFLYNFRPDPTCEAMNPDCMFFPGKIGQWQNVLLSLGLTFYLVRLAALLRPNHFDLRILSLALLGLFPVYYRTFAFVRGEPAVAFFYVFIIYHLLYAIYHEIQNPRWHYVVQLGVALGALMLSRQWGAFIVPAIIVWGIVILMRERQRAFPLLRTATLGFALGFVLSVWFFISLSARFGSVTAFSREPASGQYFFDNQPTEFYFGLGLDYLFSQPFRPEGDIEGYPNQVIPMLYSDTWGDYWGYFTIRGPFPGQVMAVSLIPTLVLAAGVLLGYWYLLRFLLFWRKGSDKEATMFALIQLVLVMTMLGYGWFIIQYPNPGKGGPIKASYLLHVYPFLAILGADVLARIKQRSRLLYPVLTTLLTLVYIHNLPMIFTQRIRYF